MMNGHDKSLAKPPGLSRRAMVTTAAWSVPAIVVSTSLPAAAASLPVDSLAEANSFFGPRDILLGPGERSSPLRWTADAGISPVNWSGVLDVSAPAGLTLAPYPITMISGSATFSVEPSPSIAPGTYEILWSTGSRYFPTRSFYVTVSNGPVLVAKTADGVSRETVHSPWTFDYHNTQTDPVRFANLADGSYTLSLDPALCWTNGEHMDYRSTQSDLHFRVTGGTYIPSDTDFMTADGYFHVGSVGWNGPWHISLKLDDGPVVATFPFMIVS